MQHQTVWDHLAVPLPALNVIIADTGTQKKGSTTWAAHSHTPLALEVWDDFLHLVHAESTNPRSSQEVILEESFEAQIQGCRLKKVSREEDVTLNIERLLEVFTETTPQHVLSGEVVYDQEHRFIGPDPDICVRRYDQNEAVGQHVSPVKGTRSQVRLELTEARTTAHMYAFETKPSWKFSFLTRDDSHMELINGFEIPPNYNKAKMQAQAPLPKSWSTKKRKIFHLVRQVYGQMDASNRRYGVLSTYENWFFCKRTVAGTLKISSPIARTDTAPSVLQALKTLTGFVDHELGPSQVHPNSARKPHPSSALRNQRRDENQDSKRKPPPSGPRRLQGGAAKRGRNSKGKVGGTGASNLAATLSLRDCSLIDTTNNIQLYTTVVDPSVLVKLQPNPRMRHIADEMENEANMYKAIEGQAGLVDVLPRFRGFSTHLGVAMTCIERESDDFDDIQADGNLSEELKQSAVCAVQALSQAGILHNDLELRNIVRSSNDPNRAKIIDLGRATFCNDEEVLLEQIKDTRSLLGIDETCNH